MKILWLSHFLLYPETGFGALQRSRNLLLGVSRRAEIHLVSLLTPAQRGDPALLARAEASLSAAIASFRYVDRGSGSGRLAKGLLALRCTVSGEPYSTALYRSDRLRSDLPELVRTLGIDLIHADTMGIAEPVVESCGVPAVLNHHNVESSMMERRATGASNRLLRAFCSAEARRLRAFEARWCPRFAMNITVSPDDAETLAVRTMIDASRIAVVENCVDTDYFQPRARVGKSQELLFLGGMDWYPNRDAVRYFLAEIWPAVSERWPQLSVTIVGREAGVSQDVDPVHPDRVTFTDFVPDVRPYLAKALACICPMRDGGGTRLKILDTLAAGVPLLSTRMGCEGIGVRDRIDVLFAETAPEWSERIGELIERPDLRESLAKNGRRLVEQAYSRNVVGDRLMEVYERARG